MPARVIQAMYPDLEQFAHFMSGQADGVTGLTYRIWELTDRLRGGDWVGLGANRFFDEMDNLVLPALNRLSEALESAGQSIQRISQTFSSAEEEAARLFQGNGALGLGRSSSGGGGVAGPGGPGGDDLLLRGVRPPEPRGWPRDGVLDFDVTGWERIPNGIPFVTGNGDKRSVHPNDISQGTIGSCAVLSSLAGIAQLNPDQIRKNIRPSDDGNYIVTLYDEKGQPVEIKVSPEFPVSEKTVTVENADGSITIKKVKIDRHASTGDINTSTGNQEIWPLLYEKAYAQYVGQKAGFTDPHQAAAHGYEIIDKGNNPVDVLQTLTGQPQIKISYPSTIPLSVLQEQLASGNPVVFSTHPLSSGNMETTNPPFVSQHAYYLTKVDAEAGTVTLRNPWGWDKGEITIPANALNTYFDSASMKDTFTKPVK